MKRVLVTGASGFLGRAVVDALLAARYSVRAATRRPSAFPGSVEAVTVPDLAGAVIWRPILEDVDAIVHLAGLVHADARKLGEQAFDSINRKATQDLAGAAREAGVERFIFISSARAQISASSAQMVREDAEPYPTDAYGRTKLAAEQAIRASGVPFTILRPVAVYGPHPRGNVETLLRLAMSPVPLPLSGLRNRRTLLSLESFISAVLFALANPATAGETYLVADPQSYTVAEFVALIRKAQGRPARLFYVPPMLLRFILRLARREALWGSLGEDLFVSTDKLQKLGWHPSADSDAAIAAMVRAEGEGARR